MLQMTGREGSIESQQSTFPSMLRRESAHEGMFTNPPAPLTRHHSHHLLWHQRERFFFKKKDSGSRSSACTATNPNSQPHLLGTRPALTQWRPRTRMRQGPDTPSFFTLHFAELWCGVTISYEHFLLHWNPNDATFCKATFIQFCGEINIHEPRSYCRHSRLYFFS